MMTSAENNVNQSFALTRRRRFLVAPQKNHSAQAVPFDPASCRVEKGHAYDGKRRGPYSLFEETKGPA